MCDYSLESIQSRPAKVGDRLTTHLFRTNTRGFSAPENKYVAVCLLPGTELSFANEIKRIGCGRGTPALSSTRPRFFARSIRASLGRTMTPWNSLTAKLFF